MPRVVFDPTFHFHTIEPVVPVFLSPRPEAVDDPEAYCTSMPQVDPGVVPIVTDAVEFRLTGPGFAVTFDNQWLGVAAGLEWTLAPALALR